MSSKKNRQNQPSSPKLKSVSTNKQPRLLPWALGIAALGFILYLNTVSYDYVLDDFSIIKENFVTKRGFEGIPDLWKYHSRHGYWNSPGELYRPIPMTMFAIEWAIAPDKPSFSHFMNILFYALSGALLFVTLACWMREYNLLLPLLATLFFMAHPVHVEVVANIKSRDEIVMFGFATLALFFLHKYLTTNKLGMMFASLGSYTLALFSKENAVTFVAIVPLMMYFFTKNNFKKIVLTTLPYLLPAILFILVRKAVIGSLTNPGETYSLDNILVAAKGGAYYANAFLLLGKYLWSLLVPYPLCSDFGFNQIPLTTWGDWRVLLSLLVWFGMGAYAVLGLRKRSLWSFAILFFFINFSIFTNLFVTIGTSYGDRLLYSASPGFGLALALILTKIFKVNWTATTPAGTSILGKNTGLLAVAGVVLFTYSVLTFSRNMAWKDSYTLYETDIETSPNSAKLNFHYALEIVQKGLKSTNPTEQKAYYGHARKRLEHAIEVFPGYHDAYSQLGLTYYRDKNYEKAMENYNLALKYKPNFPLVYSNMGIIFFESGQLDKAKEVYEKAVQYDPRMVDALRNLGAVNAMQKNFPEAIKWFKQGLEYDPENPTLNFYLGSAYKDSGQEALGQPFFEKAYRLDPSLKK
ncbi:MAG: tetratricopeptide repeat protein [Saprospiraceae bacterium]|nr:tetratricopeptide repeat protein [Saprospiraceae bacterium]MCF8250791.1 tetratricopeptide repeat protein [Saprospiraceae bacterium]MCF8281769.1 tetratricopeptide repeat protein [Bacteroidales bacterium]MCF8312592.1 tetratricopeptide repeat protein [Saprospiraceae bacterium]MCF8440921.1 tetratricopeptide repeat protein [Saprospiraceae bacterium]